MTDEPIVTELLLALLDGATFANALRRCGKPGRIRLPDEPHSRRLLVDAHLSGDSSTLEFHAEGRQPWLERVDAVAFSAFCPAADGRCRWLGIDLDADDHGEGGLINPGHAARTIAECADHTGLSSGLLVARSRRGKGRHVFLILPEPAPMADAVIGVAALAAAAFKVAASDVTECGAEHAFRCANEAIARPGDPGAVELLPRSTTKPTFGWALALPGASAYAAHGGGVIVDPFDDRPIHHQSIPRCGHEPWSQFLEEARATLSNRNAGEAPHQTKQLANYTDRLLRPIDRIDARTRAFLDGHTPEGTRNMSAFAASANLLGCGIDPREAEHLILAGATACGLPQREALNAFKSAVGALAQKQRRI
ncbi:MAG: hypothetical protein AABZ47_10090 [Planctomycetota bacterium]